MFEKVLPAARLWLVLATLVFAAGSASALSIESTSGSIDGQFGVNHNGDAVYSVPIEVPPGTGGMQPHLSLAYESSVPDGPMGVGWRLEGLEQITRCRPTLAQDGLSGAIDFSTSDRFCIDGERLVAIQGIYGADGTIYHTELESQIRVTSYGTCGSGPCWFELVRKDGVVLELGNSADSRVLREGGADARAWAVSSYRDPRGNTLRAAYTQDQGALYPHVIDYTENGELAAGRQIVFNYQNRASASARYDQGTLVRYGRALTEIRIYLLIGLVRNYTLEYDSLSGHSAPRLKRLIECAGGSCLPATTFQWTQAPATIEGYGFNSIVGFDFGLEPRSFADVNGDGRADYCRLLGAGATARLSCALAAEHGFSGELSSGAPFDFGYSFLPRVFADVNGDGRADYCRGVGDSPNIFLSCALANDSGFGLYDFNSAPGFDFGQVAPFPRSFADVNGDGRADYCRATSSHPIILACTRAESQGFATWNITSVPTTIAFDFGYGNFPRAFVDINGDGKAEYCRAVGASPNIFLSCAESNGWNFGYYDFNSAPGFDFGIPSFPQQFTDANGDGLTDYCRTVGVSPNLFVSCALSRGDGFGLYDLSSAPGFDFGYPTLPRAYTDIDGDGRTDFCRFVGNSPNIFMSCAAAREGSFGLYDFSSPSTTWLDPGYAYPRAFLPTAPGSGSSFCRMVGLSPNRVLSCTSLSNQGDRMSRIIDGHGQSIEISYASLDDRSVYTPSTGAVYPQRDVRGRARYVVSSYTRSSLSPVGTAGAFSYTYGYHYAGARTSADGRGWLGFSEIVRRDHDLGLVTITRLLQDFPFTGMTESDTLHCDPLYGRDPACTSFSVVQRTTRTYETRTPFAGVTEVLRRELLTEELEYGLPGTSGRQLFDYDSYGNVIREQRASSVDGGESSELFIHRQFWNDSGRNRLGFLSEEMHSRDAAGTEVLSKTSRVYDPETLNVSAQSRWDSTSGNLLTTHYSHDQFGNPVQISEPGGLVRDLSYEPTYRTFPVSESTRAGADQPLLTTLWAIDSRFGKAAYRAEPAGTFRLTTYDGFGRISTVRGRHPGTGTSTLLHAEIWTFDQDLAVREITTPLDWSGRQVTRRDVMDGLGRVVRSEFVGHDGQTRHQETSYSSSGRVTARSKLYLAGTQPVFETYRYDSLQRPVESVDAAGFRTLNTYSAPARVSSEVAQGTPRQKSRIIDYLRVNGHRKPASLWQGNGQGNVQGNGQRIDFRYDPVGRLEVASDPAQGDLLRQTYDSLGRQTQTWNPQAGSVDFSYDSAGRLASRVSRGGQGTRAFAYDQLGRLTQEVAQSDGVSETIDYGWDDAGRGALGRLASVTSDNGWGYGYTYDTAGRVKRQDVQVLGRAWALEQTFDPAGRSLSTLFPDGSSTASAYGDAGVLSSVDFTDIDGISRRLVEVTEILSDTRPAKVDLGPLSLEMQWTSEGLLTERSAETEGLGLVDQESIQRTAGRFVDGVIDPLAPSKSQTFIHGAAGELITAFGGYGGEAFWYSQNGDILSRNSLHYEYDSGRLVRISGNQGVVFTGAYDEGGRLSDRQLPAGSELFRYGARERLEEVKRDGATVADFLHDHHGRRLYKREAGVETFYVSRNFEQTVHAGGTQQTRYVRAPQGGYATISSGAPVARAGYPANGDQFFLTDHLGSVRKAFNGLGQLTTTLDYTPFGEIWSLEGPESFRYGFAGMELDRSTGLHYDRARYYDAGLGRFITPDSRLGAGLLEFTAFNRYTYAANDPAYFIDPTGHNIWHWIKHHLKAVAAIAISVVEVVAGVAVTVSSGGLLGRSVGAALIGGGAAGFNYSLHHLNNFEWSGWATSELVGAIIGIGVELRLEPRAPAGYGPINQNENVEVAANITDAATQQPHAAVGASPSASSPSTSAWHNLPESATHEYRGTSGVFDLRAPSGMAWAGGRL